MKWFGNRNREGNESEKVDVNPRQQEKGKLDRFQDQSPEEQKKRLDNTSQVAKKHEKLDKPNSTSSEGDPSIDQREKEKTYDPKSKLTKDDVER